VLRAPSPLHFALAATLVATVGCEERWLGALAGDPAGLADAGPPAPPRLRSSVPLDDARSVPADTPLLLIFDRPMRRDVGHVEVWEVPGISGGDPARVTRLAAADGIWFDDRDLGLEGDRDDVGLRFVLQLAEERRYAVRLGCDLESRAALPVEGCGGDALRFETVDRRAPQILRTTPREGESGVSPASLPYLELTFSEAMRAEGRLTLAGGGPARELEAEWHDATHARFPLEDPLAFDTPYVATPRGFRDRAGNRLDVIATLVDGVLDFRTGGDDVAPFVTSASPYEGRRGVNPATAEAVLDFSEPLDGERTGAGWALLVARGSYRFLRGDFEQDGRRVRFALPLPLPLDTDFRLDLRPGVWADRAGNPLDLVPVLGDGALDFRVDEDAYGPRVVASTPAEGADDVPVDLGVVELVFDEAMDPESGPVTMAVGDGAPTPLAGVWEGTRLTLDARALRADSAVRLDLTALRDRVGNPLDDGDGFLGDGALDFHTREATGNDCREPLGEDRALRLPGGGLRWTVAGDASTHDGGASRCGATGPDRVFAFTKETPRFASGGRLLHVEVRSPDGEPLAFELRGASCERPDDALPCQRRVRDGGTTLDRPAGLHHLWVSGEAAFTGAVITVEERDAWPPGESCGSPFDEDDAVYRAPSDPDGEHVFQLLPGAVRTADDGPVGAMGALPCRSEHGADAVFVFEKRAGTVLDVRAVPARLTGPGAALAMTVGLGCAPDHASTELQACEARLERGLVRRVSGPAGPVVIRVASVDPMEPFPGVTVGITERDAPAGESCEGALPWPSDGVVAATPTAAVGTRSCGGGAMTWYRTPMPGGVARVLGSGAGALALVDRTTGRTLRCGEAGSEVAVHLPAEHELCVGVGAGVERLTLVGASFGGPTGPAVDTGLRAEGLEEAAWLVSDGTDSFVGLPGELLRVAASGGLPSVRAEPWAGAAGVLTAGHLFSVVPAARAPRVFELWNGPWPGAATPWELGGGTLGPALAMASDGPELVVASHEEDRVVLHAVLRAAPSIPREVRRETALRRVVGLALDATHFYLRGEDAAGVRGIYRLERRGGGAPERLAEVDHDAERAAPLVLDGSSAPPVLYARSTRGRAALHAVQDPAGDAPLDLGPVRLLGRRGEGSLGRSGDGLLFVESESHPSGRLLRWGSP
jgi:hypothetical protein